MKITIDNQNIFFISDLHLFHPNVIKHDNRPFVDVHQMHDTIITNWNNVVTSKDIVFNLGDLSLVNKSNIKTIINQLNGNIYHINGNHDKPSFIKSLDKFIDVLDLVDLYVVDETATDNIGTKQHIVLAHYPILSWNRKHHGSWHLHGHSHQNLVNDSNYDWYYKGMVMDVGCNGINYTPISYTEIKEIFQKRHQLYNDK